MKFALSTADGAHAAGQGIGNMFKALAMAPMMRQQAEADAAMKGAQMYHHNMAGNKMGVEAQQKLGALAIQNDPLENTMLSLGLPKNLAPAFREKLATGSFGGAYETPSDGVGPVMPAPADPETVRKLGQAMSLTQRMMATGSDVHQGAQAALEEQKARGIDAVVANPALAGNYGKANAAAAGKPLFNHVGNTGYSMDSFTGGQAEANPVLAKLFGQVEGSLANQRNQSANKYKAEADIEQQKAERLRTTGALPGTGAEGSEGALSSTILNTLKVPALDAKGRPVRNPITGEQEMAVDYEAQKAFYKWTADNKRKPTATAFSQWEAQGRPGANKNPPDAPAQPKIEAVPPAPERKPNTVYQTPKGPMKWTGTGWLPAN